MTRLEQQFPQQLAEWIRIAEIPGKSRLEQKRGEYVKAVFIKEGLKVSVDSMGNVSGVRNGTGGGPTIVIAAHTDIVFPPETNTKVRTVGDTLFAPGIGDNTASVANMLATLRTMNATKFTSKGDIIFIATVQEELGLKGMEYWLQHNPSPISSSCPMVHTVRSPTAHSAFSGHDMCSRIRARTHSHRVENRRR